MRNRFTAQRRDVLRAGLGGAGGFVVTRDAHAADARIALIVDPADPIAAAPQVQWALGELRAALTAKGARVRQVDRISRAGARDIGLIVCGYATPAATSAFVAARTEIAAGSEHALLFTPADESRLRIACGSDQRGLMYAVLELADRLRHGASVSDALSFAQPLLEQPFMPVRSIMRQVVSEPLDKAWFEDREMWPHYFRMLANSRFNRLHLGFGLGYDTLRGVTDSYMLFLYPFLLDVPGYDVRVTNLTDEERSANLATLRYISEQAVAHGVDFQLGIWTHGYELIDSPDARYHVTGLTRETHAAYCRDALTALLRECPAISSVALRFHGESGIAEGSYDFWQTIYQGVPACGRVVEIDLHAKGVDEEMIARARSTGMPINVSEKCWAEHHGMPYHQADIRPSERPREGQVGDGLLTLSEGSLSFTRYGYADLLREDRDYTVRHRVFAGTQRILLSGDPAWAAAYAERFVFCGTDGVDLMEPLTCRGRRGTGIPGTRRSGYIDASLEPRYDWEKYLYWYRVWGRLTYNPAGPADAWRRHFNATPNASALVSALARASRILPIVTSAHMPSAACDAYWPEIAWNQPMVGEPPGNLYWDTPSPKDFQHVTGHDPQLFTSIDECALELLAGQLSGRYSPIEVAVWLEGLVASVEADLAAIGAPTSVETRRLVIDVQTQAGLGRFFAAKFRAGVLFAIHEYTSDRRALDEALVKYRLARAEWAALSERLRNIYAPDLSVSDKYSERSHWLAHLPPIDEDIARVEARRVSAIVSTAPGLAAAIDGALSSPRRRRSPVAHTQPVSFEPGADVNLNVQFLSGQAGSLRFYYRHLNQAERWREAEVVRDGDTHRVVIPAAYTYSSYPLQYYFVVQSGPMDVSLYPGFGDDLMAEPYCVVAHRA